MTRKMQSEQPYPADTHSPTLDAYNISANEVESDDVFGWKVIAVISFYDANARKGLWSAYRGYTTWSDDFIREHGDKVSQIVADLLFPTLAHTPGLQYYDR